VHVIVVISCFV